MKIVQNHSFEILLTAFGLFSGITSVEAMTITRPLPSIVIDDFSQADASNDYEALKVGKSRENASTVETGYPEENVIGGTREMSLSLIKNVDELEEVSRLQIATATGILNFSNDSGATSRAEVAYRNVDFFLTELLFQGYDRFDLKFGRVDQTGGNLSFSIYEEETNPGQTDPTFVAIDLTEDTTVSIPLEFLINSFDSFDPVENRIDLIAIKIESTEGAFDATIDSITIEGEETINISPQSTPESISLLPFFILGSLGITSIVQKQLKY